MTQLKVGQRVNLLSKSVGQSYRMSQTCSDYDKGLPVYIKRINGDGLYRVAVEGGLLGGYFKRTDLAPWNNLEESEEL